MKDILCLAINKLTPRLETQHISTHPLRLAPTPDRLPPLPPAALSLLAGDAAKRSSGASGGDGAVPSLGELGYGEEATTPFRGGEAEALARMERCVRWNSR